VAMLYLTNPVATSDSTARLSCLLLRRQTPESAMGRSRLSTEAARVVTAFCDQLSGIDVVFRFTRAIYRMCPNCRKVDRLSHSAQASTMRLLSIR